MAELDYWIALAVRFYATKYPGRLRSLASHGEEGKQRFVSEAAAELRNPVIRAALAAEGPRLEQVDQVLDKVLLQLDEGGGEAGEVARTHPAWLGSAILSTARRVIADARRSPGRRVSPGL